MTVKKSMEVFILDPMRFDFCLFVCLQIIGVTYYDVVRIN